MRALRHEPRQRNRGMHVAEVTGRDRGAVTSAAQRQLPLCCAVLLPWKGNLTAIAASVFRTIAELAAPLIFKLTGRGMHC